MTDTELVFNPDRLFTVWAICDIYDGEGVGTVVPNINDAVWDWNTGLYRVILVDIETGLSTLERHKEIKENPFISTEDILMGSVPGRVSESYRLYINSKTQPINASVDSRLNIYGSDNKYIRLFKGFDISDNGEVVSLYYDKNNNLNDDKIPLELAMTIQGISEAVKSPMSGYVNKGLVDGEVITCVVYSVTGIVTSVNPLLVKNTSYIRNTSAEQKYVTHLSMYSPFLVNDSPDRLEVPLHTPVEDLNISVNVHYSDGDIVIFSVSDERITVDGLESFSISQKGQTTPVVVNYHFNKDEANYCATSDTGGSLSKIYQLTTMPPLAKGIVKLFVIPIWNTELKRWDLEYYLYNLDRDVAKSVTQFVEVISITGNAFDPIDYGKLQRLILIIDLKNIDELEVDYRFNQEFEITLLSPIAERVPSWTIGYVESGNMIYGDNQVARIISLTNVIYIDLSQTITSFDGWLDRMFTPLFPLYSNEEEKPMMPSHLILIYKNVELMVSVDRYDEEIEFPVKPLIGETIICKWINRTEAKDYLLAISGLTVVFEV